MRQSVSKSSGLEVADDEGHGAIVAGRRLGGAAAKRGPSSIRVGIGFPQPTRVIPEKKSMLGPIVHLPGPQPRTYHRHQRTVGRRGGTPSSHRRRRRGCGPGGLVFPLRRLQPSQRNRSTALGAVGLRRQRTHPRLALAQQLTAFTPACSSLRAALKTPTSP